MNQILDASSYSQAAVIEQAMNKP